MGITGFLALLGTRVIGSIGYAGVFLLMAAESMVLPVPSEAVMPFVGFLVSEGRFSALAAAGCATLGSIVGSLASYAIGLFGGKPFLLQYGRFLLLNERDLARSDSFFKKRGIIAVFAARFVPIVRHFISIPAGMAGMGILPFCLYTIVGAAAWNTLLMVCGYLLRSNWARVMQYGHVADIAVLAMLVGFVAVMIVRYLRRKSETAS